MLLGRLSTRSIFIAFILLLGCSKDEVEPTPVVPTKLAPSISMVSRTVGFQGVKVKITGQNFDPKSLINNWVKFGNTAAKVDSISSTELIVEAPAIWSTVSISVTTPGGTAIGPSFRYYDVYILGGLKSDGYDAIGVWKNGTIDIISVAGKHARPTAFYVDGDNTYVSGNISGSGGQMPAYWVNNVLATFDTQPTSGATTDIMAAEGSVYVSGYISDGSTQRPTYWKDGATNYLSDAPYLAEKANSIFVESGKVYVTGYQGKSDMTPVGTYWVDGVPQLLLDGSNTTYGNQIVVNGGAVYVMGISNNGLVYWADGVLMNVEDGANSVGKVIKIFGDDLIIGGYENADCCGPVGTIWIQGSKTRLFSGGDTRVYSLDLMNDDAFLGGAFRNYASSTATPYYAFNDQLIPLKYSSFNYVLDFIVK